MSLLGLISLLAAGTGIYKYAQAYEHNQDTKRIIETTQKDYDDTRSKLMDQARRTEFDTERLGKLRFAAWTQDMKRFVEVYSRFSGAKLKGKVLKEFGMTYSVSNSVSMNELQTLSADAETLIGTGAVGAIGGALAAWGIYGLVAEFGVAATTGTAIGTLSGAAAHNATMAYLGGGALSIGGGGMAAGSAALTGLGIGTGIGIGGFLTEYQLRMKNEEARIQSNNCYMQIDEMNRMYQHLQGLSSLTNRFYNFELDFAELFRNMLSDMETVFFHAVERRSSFGKWLSKEPDKIHVRKLTMKELKELQLLGFASQVYYSLLSIPLAKDEYVADQEAQNILKNAMAAYHSIKDTLSDIQTLSDEEFKAKYETTNQEVKPIIFEIPERIRIVKKSVWQRFREFMAKVRSAIMILITYAVLVGMIYVGYTVIRAKWYYYLGVGFMWLATLPIPARKEEKRSAYQRFIQLLIASILLGLVFFFLKPEILEVYKELLISLMVLMGTGK